MKTFVIRDRAIADRACAYIHSVVGAYPPLAVTVSEYHGKRTRDQNDRLYKALRTIAEEGWLNGRQGSVEDWKVYLLLSGGFAEVYTDIATGEQRAIPMPTSKMTVKQMSELIEYVVRYAAETLGIEV
jgi:hypothetical protein